MNKVWVLTGWVQYQGDEVLGVYGSEQSALDAADLDHEKRRKERSFTFDRYHAQDYEILGDENGTTKRQVS